MIHSSRRKTDTEIDNKGFLPFTAFVNQEQAKLALMLVVINPRINGLLLKGEKGTGKSGLVRALASILPSYEYVKGCPFHCTPENPAFMCKKCRKKLEEETIERKKTRMRVVTLPLGATEDMIVGGLNTEKALQEGKTILQPGLLAEANRNILYIDEINLLSDHLVDVILDAAAMNWNYIEREGISIIHPARFTLIGSMNPEEGGLRPQLLDRFALSVQVEKVKDKESRTKIIQRNLEFQDNPREVLNSQQDTLQDLKDKISKTREWLNEVTIPEELLYGIGRLCKELKVDGHRPDILITLTAKTIAAFHERKTVRSEDIKLASNFVLGHRTRAEGSIGPPESDEIYKVFEKIKEELQVEREVEAEKGGKDPKTMIMKNQKESNRFDQAIEPGKEYDVMKDKEKAEKKRKKAERSGKVGGSFLKKKAVKAKKKISKVAGKFKQKLRSIWKQTLSNNMVATKKKDDHQSVPLPEISMQDYSSTTEGKRTRIPEVEGVPVPKRLNLKSIKRVRGYSSGRRAPVISKANRGKVIGYERPKGPIVDIAFGPTIRAAALAGRQRGEIKKEDIRVKVREHRARAILSVIFDTSKSMWQYLSPITRALLKFHDYAWRSKDKVGLIEARGEEARILREPTSNRKKIRKSFLKVREGGKTPLASALLKSYNMVTLEKRKNKDNIPIIILVSDGLGNVEIKHASNTSFRKKIAYPSQADILEVTRRCSHQNIPILVLNPMHLDQWPHPQVISPTKLLQELARMTNGKYIGFRRYQFFQKSKEYTSNKVFEILKDSLQSVIQSRSY